MHYRLLVEYDGTDFHGWQVQPDTRTVQGTLETALGRLLGVPTRVAAAGRTDAGVHATGQVVCFHSDRVLSLTPVDLSIAGVDTVADDFDPRRAACRRSYRYRIWTRAEPSPFWRRYAWHVPWALDLGAMRTAAAHLLGEHDFSSFRAAGCDAVHPVRRVFVSTVEHHRDLLSYEIEATAFLRHMVRNIVGTLVEVGQGRRSPDLCALVAARDRTLAAATAPALGLCLTAVRY
jgi:tRNA pseudouridine38-40 synthase